MQVFRNVLIFSYFLESKPKLSKFMVQCNAVAEKWVKFSSFCTILRVCHFLQSDKHTGDVLFVLTFLASLFNWLLIKGTLFCSKKEKWTSSTKKNCQISKSFTIYLSFPLVKLHSIIAVSKTTTFLLSVIVRTYLESTQQN